MYVLIVNVPSSHFLAMSSTQPTRGGALHVRCGCSLSYFSALFSLPLSLPFPSQTATFAEGEKILAFHGPQIYEGKVCDVLLVITMSFLYKNAIWREMYLNTPQSGTAHRTAKTPHAAPVVTPY